MPNVEGFIEEGKKRAKKCLDVPLHGLWGEGVKSPLKAEARCHSAQFASMCCKPSLVLDHRIAWHSVMEGCARCYTILGGS
jgi:hypothetical protein